MVNNRTNFDFTFVLPPFDFFPPGGYMVVFELASYLTEKGYKVLLVFIKDIKNNLIRSHFLPVKVDNEFKLYTKQKLFMIGIHHKSIVFLLLKFYNHLHKIYSLFGINLNPNALSGLINIEWTTRNRLPGKLVTDRLIATAWETAYFVNKFNECKLKYYLVQNSEDDPSFSGPLSELARKSYDFKLKKLVINKHMQERFNAENPIKITVAAHINGKLERKPEDRNNNIILFQLRNGEDKGAEYAIEGARLTKSKRPEVEIISYGNYNGNLPSFIKHYGYVSDSEYVELFNSATIFVLPSLVEGFPTPVLEAMSCGCVPVATKCGGPEEMINHEVNGILIPAKDSQAISDNVLLLLDNRVKRIQMAYRAIDTSLNYSIEKMGNEFVDGISKYEKETTHPI